MYEKISRWIENKLKKKGTIYTFNECADFLRLKYYLRTIYGNTIILYFWIDTDPTINLSINTKIDKICICSVTNCSITYVEKQSTVLL